MKRILIIEREYGCGAGEVAERAAKQLGWRLLDNELTQEIARLTKVDPGVCAKKEEQLDSWVYRLGKIFWRGSYEQMLPVEGPEILDADRMVHLVRHVVTQAADSGECVIVGRGAPYFLRERSDIFSVFLFAPGAFKLEGVTLFLGDRTKAENLVDSVDQSRAAFIKHYFQKDWPSRHLYHLMVNTAMGIDATVDLVLRGMEAAGRVEAPQVAMD